MLKLRIKLEAICDSDQQYRTQANADQMDAAQLKFGTKSKEYQKIYGLITTHDKVNQQEIIPILEKYGWLGKSEVGEKANEAIFYVVHHSDSAMRMKYVSLMRASASKGESNALHLKWLEGRILRDQGRDQPDGGGQPYSVRRKDGTIDYYGSRQRANEELIKEGLDTIGPGQ